MMQCSRQYTGDGPAGRTGAGHPCRQAGKAGIHAFYCISAVLLAVFVTCVAAGNAVAHNFKDSDCLGCHAALPSGSQTGPLEFIGPISELCSNCHGDIDEVTHRLGMKPTFAVPAFMPLDGEGRLTCATCHDPHMPDRDVISGLDTHLLRVPEGGKWSCQLCHKSALSATGKETHRPVMSLAHGFTRFTLKEDSGELDTLSVGCLGCHDRPGLPDLVSPGAGAWRHGTNTYIPHHVGVNYEEKAWNNSNLILRTDEEKVVLFDGKVGCCTCHDPYMPGGGLQLREGYREQYEKLCLNCHDRRCPGSGECRIEPGGGP